MKGLTNYLFHRVIIIIPFCCFILSAQSQIVGSRDNSAAPAREVKAAALSGGESGDVNLFTGTFGSTQTLGTVKTLSGLSFTLNLSWNSSFTAGDNPGIVSGVPYGDGWNLNIPTITISTAAYHKFSAQDESNHFMLPFSKTDLVFSLEDLKNEGNLFWFSPFISIPGVISERFVFKYKDKRSNECVFVPHTFEKYVEARFDGRSWQVILEDGTVYDFSLCQVAQRAPSNQKAYFSQGVDIRTNAGIMDNLVMPKNEVMSWYCGKIKNPNHAFGQIIVFNYDAYGAFDFFTELSDQPNLMAAYTSVYHPTDQWKYPFHFFEHGLNSENESRTVVAYKDILLKEVIATVDGGIPFDRLQLNYNTVDVQNTVAPIRTAAESINGVILQPSTTSGLLLRGDAGVEIFDDLYNYKTVYNFSGTWNRYKHAMSYVNGNQIINSTTSVNATNPYLFPGGSGITGQQYWREQATSGKFEGGFLESPDRIGADFTPGDLYEIKTKLRMDNISANNIFMNFDINLASGYGDYTNSGCSNCVSLNPHTNNTPGLNEPVFSTFNNALKWTLQGQSMDDPLKTRNLFVMPNNPVEYDGFYIQIGPANSDNKFDLSEVIISDISQSGIAGNPVSPFKRSAFTTYWDYLHYHASSYFNLNQNPTMSTEKIQNNFGIGLPWHLVSPIYNALDFSNTSSAPDNMFQNRYMFWWNHVQTGGLNWPNQPIVDKNNDVVLSDVKIIRYSKNTYMLGSVDHYRLNGETDARDYHEIKPGGGENLISRFMMEYDVHVDNLINNKVYNGATPSYHGVQNVFLLKRIRQIPSKIINETPGSTIDFDALPAISFEYNEQEILRARTNSYCQIREHLITKVTDYLGKVTEIGYKADWQSYDRFILNANFLTHTYIDGQFIPKQEILGERPFPFVYQVNAIVDTKKVTDFNIEENMPVVKTWNYVFENGIRNDANSGANYLTTNLNFDVNQLNFGVGFANATIYEPNDGTGNPRSFIKYTHYGYPWFGKIKSVVSYDDQGHIMEGDTTEYYQECNFCPTTNDTYFETSLANHTMVDLEPVTLNSGTWLPGAYDNSSKFLEKYYNDLFATGITPVFSTSYTSSLFIGKKSEHKTRLDKLLKDVVSNPYINGNTTGNEYASQSPNLTVTAIQVDAVEINTDSLPVTNITEYEYYSATATEDIQSGYMNNITKAEGYSVLIPGLPNSTTVGNRIDFDPSWQIFRTKQYSPQLPGVSHIEENYYSYDLANIYGDKVYYDDFQEVFPAVYWSITRRLRNIPFEKRVITRSPNSNDQVHSEYYNYGTSRQLTVDIPIHVKIDLPPHTDVCPANWITLAGYDAYNGTQNGSSNNGSGNGSLNNGAVHITHLNNLSFLWYYLDAKCHTPLHNQGPAENECDFLAPDGSLYYCPCGAMARGVVHKTSDLDMLEDPSVASRINVGTENLDKLLLKEIYTQTESSIQSLYISLDASIRNNHNILRFKAIPTLVPFGNIFANPPLSHSVNMYTPIYPFDKLLLKRVLTRNYYGQEELTEDEKGLITRYQYNLAEYRYHWTFDPQFTCYNYSTFYQKDIGMPTAIILGSGRPDSLSTFFRYTQDYQLDSLIDPNGLVTHYTFDAYRRLKETYINNKLRTINNYHLWNRDESLGFNERAANNYVETAILMDYGLNRGQYSRSYIDPIGGAYNTATISSENVFHPQLSEKMIHSGDMTYDLWNRPVKTYHPFTVSDPPSLVPFSPRFRTNTSIFGVFGLQVGKDGFAEKLYENNSRGRILNEAKPGELLHAKGVSRFVCYDYGTISGLRMSYELGFNNYLDELILPGDDTKYAFEKTKVIDEDFHVTITYTNPLGQKVAVRQFSDMMEIGTGHDEITLFVYDGNGNIIRTINPEKQETSYKFNTLNRQWKQTTVDGGISNYIYNKSGHVVLEVDGNGRHQTGSWKARHYEYDIYGNMILQDKADVDPVYFGTNEERNTNSWLWPDILENRISNRILEKRFFYNNDVSTMFLHNRANVFFNHSRTNMKGHLSHSISYNNQGLPVQYHLLSYNKEGQVRWEIKQFNNNGITDGDRGSLVRIDYPKYNLRGQLQTENVDINCNLSLDFQHHYTYDNFGRLDSVLSNYDNSTDHGNLTANYEYNDDNNSISTLNYYYKGFPIDATDYLYDDRLRLTQISSALFDFKLYYDNEEIVPNSNPSNNPPPGGGGGIPVLNGGNNSSDYPTNHFFNGNINATIADYHFNNVINPPSIFGTGTYYAYTYDGLNRLVLANRTPGNLNNILSGFGASVEGDETYAYDHIGNFKNLTRNNFDASQQSFDYNYEQGTNRLLDISGSNTMNFTTDYNGNMLTHTFRNITGTEYGRSNLPFQNDVNGKQLKMLYDESDQRIFKTTINGNDVENLEFYLTDIQGHQIGINNLTTNKWEYYVYGKDRIAKVVPDESRPVLEDYPDIATENDPLSEPLRESGNIEVINGEFSYYIYDHLGNTRITYQPQLSGSSVQYQVNNVYDYFSYGKVLRSFSNTIDEKFLTTFHERDVETGLDNRGARFYDSDVSRFLSLDPDADVYDSWSPYCYVIDNPTRNVDPDGKGVWDALIGFVVATVDNTTGLDLRSTYSPTSNKDIDDYNTGQDFGDVGSILLGDGEIGVGKGLMEASAGSLAVTGGGSVPVSGPGLVLGGLVTLHGANTAARGAYNFANQKGRVSKNETPSSNKKGPKDLVGEAKAEKAKAQKAEERTNKRETATKRGNSREGLSNQSTKGSHHSGGKKPGKHDKGDDRRAKDQKVKGPDNTK